MEVNELIKYLFTPAAQIALIIGLAEILKKIGVPTRFIPIADIVLGLVSGICVYGLAMGYKTIECIVLGIALGLSACGLFSGIKNVTERESYDE